MQLKAQQLAGALRKGLAPVYLISGDEPQQLGELADAVRKAAKADDYLVREVLAADRNFDWKQLHSLAAASSIFADKKILDLRLPYGTPGAEGAKALASYCRDLPQDTLLLITAGKISSEALKSAWLQALDRIGVIVQVWPLAGADFISWLQNRLQKRGLSAEREAMTLLAARQEGNLLAAAQEIEKLYVLYGAGTISGQQVADAVADNSRYDVFKLVEAALQVKPPKVIKILEALKSEGIAPAIVLWALMRECRLIINYKAQSYAEKDVFLKKNGIWGERKQLIEQSAKRLDHKELNQALIAGAQADRQIKGQQPGDAWTTLLTIGLRLASVSVLAEAL